MMKFQTTVWMAFALAGMGLASFACSEGNRKSGPQSEYRMTDGTVLEVTPTGDVKIGARASLVVTANDGMVYIQGPFAVGDDLIVENGKVRIKNLETSAAAAERIRALESRIASLEKRLQAMEEQKLARK
ncbi:MAG: hypothetical protein KDK25_11285 [Leptospiraceae bacterium]|nr:hypothetical protein [Leptospiraceae bacterium]